MRVTLTAILLAMIPLAVPASDKGKDRADKDYAAELPRIAPTEPKDALKTFKLAAGFKIELVAAEPLIRSPVAVDFDEDGRMYVAEFPEYNLHGLKNGPKVRGCIKLLEDTTGNGVYDKMTVFADNIDSPVALACWDGGVFVGAVPDILYLKDTTGNGKADLRKVIYTGFGRDKAGEAMLNSFRWGLDNRFHVSTSAAGGDVKRAEVKDARVYSVRGQGFLFDPRTLSFELVAGSGQHGMSMDDWGRKFTCDNSNPAHVLMYDGRYLQDNPYAQAPPPMLNIHGANKAGYLKRISPNEPWRVLRTKLRVQGVVPGPTETGQPSGHFTGTTGVTAYRGNNFPAAYRNTLFVGEVANNLVYHARLTQQGLVPSAQRFETDVEFLASTDTWFRPAQFANAPDGTLYVIDMYRELIETVESIPPAILKHLHPESGVERGRIYRIRSEQSARNPRPRLSKASTAELVELLDHANGWHRDTSARLLYQRQDAQAIAPLKRLALSEKSLPQGRVQALYALDGLGALDAKVLSKVLGSGIAPVEVHVLRLCERFPDDAELARRVRGLTSDADLRVRYQLAFTLGKLGGKETAAALAALADKDVADPWMRFAILTSAQGRRGELFRLLAGNDRVRQANGGQALLAALAVQIGAANQAHEIAEFLTVLDGVADNALRRQWMAGMMSKLPASARKRIEGAGKAGDLFKELLADALKSAGDEKKPLPERLAAVRTLGLTEFVQVRPLLQDLLTFRQPEAVQLAALETLARFERADVAQVVVKAWPGLSPRMRSSAAETLLARPAWIAAFFDAVENGTIKTGDVDPARIRLLQTSADAKVRERAGKLFAANQLSKRQDVVDQYQKALKLKGDAKIGKEIFKKQCAACHRLEGFGEQVGADLSAIAERGAEFIVLNVLDPNREVLPKYITYQAVTDAGLSLTGMISAETATSITLRRFDGTSSTILRVNLAELRSLGVSFMPEGLEKQISVQEMADLLSYLLSVR